MEKSLFILERVLNKKSYRFRLVAEDVVIPSFNVQYGYKNKLCAADVVQACVATLESIVS